jgi:hypothetical protein
MGDPEAGELEESFQEVLKDVGTEIPDMGIIIDCRPACIDLDFAGNNGMENFFAAREGIKKLNHDGLL